MGEKTKKSATAVGGLTALVIALTPLIEWRAEAVQKQANRDATLSVAQAVKEHTDDLIKTIEAQDTELQAVKAEVVALREKVAKTEGIISVMQVFQSPLRSSSPVPVPAGLEVRDPVKLGRFDTMQFGQGEAE